MKQPKKLPNAIEYSGDIFVPELDMDLDEFVKLSGEHLNSHEYHENLEEVDAKHIGENVFITEDLEIDDSQFEEKEDEVNPQKLKRESFLRKFVN
jgi:hypothetical protein